MLLHPIGMEESTLTDIDAGASPRGGHPRRDGLGTVFGLLVFFGGVALLVVTFRLAYQLFTVPPESALGIQHGKTLDIARAGDLAAVLILRVILLLIMAFVGAMIANRGIALYAGARGLHR